MGKSIGPVQSSTLQIFIKVCRLTNSKPISCLPASWAVNLIPVMEVKVQTTLFVGRSDEARERGLSDYTLRGEKIHKNNLGHRSQGEEQFV